MTPLGEVMWYSLNIPGHPIIATEKVIKLPSNEMEKTATSDDYISNHFQDKILLCSLIFQKQESREMPHTNLAGLTRKNLRGGTLSLFLCRDNKCLKEDNSKSLTQGPQLVLTNVTETCNGNSFRTGTGTLSNRNSFRKNLRGGTLYLFLCRDNKGLKEDNSKLLTHGPQ